MKTLALAFFVATMIFASGCATKVTFTSDPPDAYINYRGEGRAAFRHKTAPKQTPVTVDMYYGRISAFALWHEVDPVTRRVIPVFSTTNTLVLSSFRSKETMHFVMPGKAPEGL